MPRGAVAEASVRHQGACCALCSSGRRGWEAFPSCCRGWRLPDGPFRLRPEEVGLRRQPR